MSSTMLELLRTDRCLAEKYELMVGEELSLRLSGQRSKVMQQHRIKQLCEKVADLNKNMQQVYEDQDGLLNDEVLSMKGNDVFSSFYAALTRTTQFYVSSPPQPATGDTFDILEPLDVVFSGEEIFGKYLDLQELHLEFSNLTRKINVEQDYLQYLERLTTFFYLPDTIKQSKPFLDYLDRLWQHLCHFVTRAHPLFDLAAMTVQWEEDYQRQHAPKPKVVADTPVAQPLRLGMFNDPTELEALGADRLKSALEAMGLKCGGTLQDRANRLWAVRGKKPEEYPTNLLAKPNSKKRKLDDLADDPRACLNQGEWKELRVKLVGELLAETIQLTRRHAEKQQSLTVDEKEVEIFEEEHGIGAEVDEDKPEGEGDGKDKDDDEDDQPVYNPLNLPLGWDGKPIPYWMYKLHGLGVEYKCEICGNQSYWGRRAFDRHFQEFRHAHGMKCLGIPNTKHFHDITQIEDAIALYEKIKDKLPARTPVAATSMLSAGSAAAAVDSVEEFEDTDGNVLDRRTYEDLARQGLL